MVLPSRDQVGTDAASPPVENAFGTALCGSMRYSMDLPEARESKTNSFPSGDHLGDPVRALKFVSGRALLPSASEIQSSCGPERVDSNRICLPSGDRSAER